MIPILESVAPLKISYKSQVRLSQLMSMGEGGMGRSMGILRRMISFFSSTSTYKPNMITTRAISSDQNQRELQDDIHSQ